jgi:hypothetical protein
MFAREPSLISLPITVEPGVKSQDFARAGYQGSRRPDQDITMISQRAGSNDSHKGFRIKP